MEDRPILITGCARSGTSMTGGIVSICGAWGGKMSGPTLANAKGMFENEDIRNQLKKPYLRKIGCDPMGQHPLPDLSDHGLLKRLVNDSFEWRNSVYKIIRNQGYDGLTQWFYKGAKMCLLWPIWHNAFPYAKWIIVRRKAEDIINSCMKTGFMRAYKNEGGWRKWVYVHEERFAEMKEAGLYIFEVWPEKMIYGDFSEIENVIKQLDLDWKEKEARDFISPKLWKGGKV